MVAFRRLSCASKSSITFVQSANRRQRCSSQHDGSCRTKPHEGPLVAKIKGHPHQLRCMKPDRLQQISVQCLAQCWADLQTIIVTLVPYSPSDRPALALTSLMHAQFIVCTIRIKCEPQLRQLSVSAQEVLIQFGVSFSSLLPSCVMSFHFWCISSLAFFFFANTVLTLFSTAGFLVTQTVMRTPTPRLRCLELLFCFHLI
jgi:hypothetical protein